jgi:hypothetical protein
MLHWKSGHKIACKRKGVWISSAVQHPNIAKILDALDNEPKHGGVAEPKAASLAKTFVRR